MALHRNKMAGSGLYQPLPMNTIRLLRLKPGSAGSAMQGQLHVVHLKEQPTYQALSWAWGTEPILSAPYITLNGDTRMPISLNLNHALEYFRHEFKIEVPYLWIDQLCINQQDDHEKEFQIAIMGEIYSAASMVVVWLGQEPSTGEAAKAALAARAIARKPIPNVDSRLSPSSVTQACIAQILEYHDPSRKVGVDYTTTSSRYLKGEGYLLALITLCCQPWFKRLWVRQEVALAQDVQFVYENVSIPYKVFESAVRVCLSLTIFQAPTGVEAHAQSLTDRDTTRETILRLFDITAQLRTKKSHYERPSLKRNFYERPSLLEMLEMTQLLETSKSHDRIYAIYQLSSAAQWQRFVPDYSRPELDLWTDVATFILNDTSMWNSCTTLSERCPAVVFALPAIEDEDRSLAVSGNDSRRSLTVSNGERRKQRDRRRMFSISRLSIRSSSPAVVEADAAIIEAHQPLLPTWVPDFGRTSTRNLKKMQYWQSNFFKAGGQPPTSTFSPRIDPRFPSRVGVQGVEIQRISTLYLGTKCRYAPRHRYAATWKSPQFWRHVCDDLIPWYLRCYACIQDCIPPDWCDIDVFLSQGTWKKPGATERASLMNLTNFTDATSEAMPPELNEFQIAQMFEALLPSIGRRLALDRHDDRRIMARFEGARIDSLAKRLGPSNHEHQGLADIGGLGWVPDIAKVGDQVILFQGVPMPFIVRDSGKAGIYNIVGDAYIHGIMQGQAWEELKDEVVMYEFE